MWSKVATVLISLWLLGWSKALNAQTVTDSLEQVKGQRTPIVLERANSLRSYDENGVRRQELIGDVMITKDSLSVFCHNAEYYPDSGLIFFRTNVEFRDPHRTLLADEVVYNEYTEEVNASSRVRVYQSDTLSATSSRARYFERLRQGYLYDNVQLREERRRLLLAGQAGFLDHERKYGRVTGKPVLTERDSTLRVVTVIRGDTVEYFGDSKTARVTGKVEVERDSLTARGTHLNYYTEDRVAVLTGAPEAERGADEIRGDTLKLFFEGEQLSRVEVWGHAVATSPADSGLAEPRNRMEGRQMTLWIKDGLLDQALVQGTAIATYFVRDRNEKKGLNVTSGDRIRIFFENRKISRIRVEGGTEGDYTPQKLVNEL